MHQRPFPFHELTAETVGGIWVAPASVSLCVRCLRQKTDEENSGLTVAERGARMSGPTSGCALFVRLFLGHGLPAACFR